MAESGNFHHAMRTLHTDNQIGVSSCSALISCTWYECHFCNNRGNEIDCFVVD